MPSDSFSRAYFGSVTYPPGGTLLGRVQTHVQWVGLHTGELNLVRDGVSHFIPSGHGFFLVPGSRYDFYFSKQSSSRHTWIDFLGGNRRPGVSSESRELAKLPLLIPIGARGEKQIETLLTFSREEMARGEEIFLELCRAFYFWFIGEGKRTAKSSNVRTQKPIHPAIDAAQLWLNEHLSETLRLADLAEEVGLSPEHFVRLYRKETGLTPMASLWKLRVDKARELLEHSGLSLDEIASQTGFANVYHFSRRIRAETGYPPSLYRERLKSKGVEIFKKVGRL
ncbi:MAG: helix-turn-helix domain-containing protein [Spirochaetia bacterium]|nr:helix-turn-helix domain-containing protein [Spirochaetia bacterium]